MKNLNIEKRSTEILEMTDFELHEAGLLLVKGVSLESGIPAAILETALNNSYKRADYGESVLIGYLTDTSEPDIKTTHVELLEWVEKFSK